MARIPIGRANASLGRKIFKDVYGKSKNIKYEFIKMISEDEKLFEFKDDKSRSIYIAFGKDFATTYSENIEMFGGH